MVFDFDAATSLDDMTPSQAISLDMYNHSPVAQTNWMTHSVSTTNETSVSLTNTYEHSVNMGFHAEAHGEITPMGVGGGASFGWHRDENTMDQNNANTNGISNSTTMDDTQMLMANVPPFSKVTANMLVFNGFVDIPFSADTLITYAGGFTQHSVRQGIYNNVRTTRVVVTYSDAKPIDKKHEAAATTSPNNARQPGAPDPTDL